MENQYSSLTIANWFIEKDESMRNDIMKILKLVYISHGFHLALTGTPLIKETVQAWQYGPVIPELYFHLKANRLEADFNEFTRLKSDSSLINFLEVIYSKYKKLNGAKLSQLTHQKDTPWDITVSLFKSQISEELIKNHYMSLLNKNSSQ